MAGVASTYWWRHGRLAPQPPSDDLRIFPRVGMSIASLIVASKCNIKETVKRFQDAGVQLTRVNLLTARWPEVDVFPYRRLPDGRWSLYAWNAQYFDRLFEVRERMNQAGIAVIWTNRELYSWSHRKPGPQQFETPWRHNVDGVYWDPGDVTLTVLPDDWSREWFKKVVPLLGMPHNAIEIGNEMPEKGLHERDADLIRAVQANAHITVNRNEDTPGQYANMKIGTGRFDRISFHGRRLQNIRPDKDAQGHVIRPQGDLDEIYKDEPTYKTFNQFFDNCPHDPKRVIFSSDGARKPGAAGMDPVNTYYWDELREFAREVTKHRGCSFEHQSRAKMTPPPNHHMIEVEWFRSVIT